MSGDAAGEFPPQARRRRINPRWAYPEAAAIIEDYSELSALAPEEIRRYCGGKR